MKRKLFIIIPIIVIAIVFVIIFLQKDNETEKVAENFLKTYYSFSEENVVELKSPSDNEKLVKKLKEQYQEVAWDKCIELLIINRYYNQILDIYSKENDNIIYQQATLDVQDTNTSEKNIKTYNYECVFKVSGTNYTATGQLILENQDNMWKVKDFIPISTNKNN